PYSQSRMNFHSRTSKISDDSRNYDEKQKISRDVVFIH
ncbi:MAG: hypothetical protein ACI90V_011765, partial [Bacillariaceae sp.]